MIEEPKTEEAKPERPGHRFFRIPFEILGDILQMNPPYTVYPGYRGPEIKDDELWLSRCEDWPKNGVVVDCSVDFQDSTLLVKVESSQFKKDPDGLQMPIIELRYNSIRVQEWRPADEPHVVNGSRICPSTAYWKAD